MVVLPAQCLAQLEAVVVAGAHDALQDAGAFQHDEIAVQRTLRYDTPVATEQVRNGHRPPRRGDEVEDRPPLARMTMATTGEATLGGGVQLDVRDATVARCGGRHAATVPLRELMNRVLEHLDRLQRRHAWLSLPVAVFKRFGEHGGGRLATTISYWSFFSIFPLLLAFVTVLNVVLEDNPDTRQDLVDGALGQVPVLGTELADSQTALGGSWATVAIGVFIAVWSGLAAANTFQFALEEIWDTPPFERPNGAVYRMRSVAFLVVLAVGLSASTLAVSSTHLVDLGRFGSVAAYVVSFLVDAAILLVTFRMFITGRNSLRELLPGVVVAAAGIVALQAVGSIIVQRYIAGASDTYGTFAVVFALLSWFFLVSRLILLSAELNAVRHHRLVPRSLVASAPVTDADRRAVLYDARRVQRDRRIGVATSVDGADAADVV
jgi:membrane protein